MDDEVPRRTYLNSVLATGLAASIAGCNTSSDGSNSDSTTAATTAVPNQPPRILSHDATPQNNGTSLAVSLEGEDDDGLSLARIEYGEKATEAAPEDTSVTLSEEFTELEASTLEETPGQVTYLLRDTDGKETRVEAAPDESPPDLQALSIHSTTSAGEIAVQITGRDDTGLEAIEVRLGEQPLLQTTDGGQQEYRINQTVSVPESKHFQQHTITASLVDWNGNATEREAETYVRKYDVMEDTRLDVGALYFPWIGQKFGSVITENEANPVIGHYDDLRESPMTDVVNRHLDQIQSCGINSVMFSFGEADTDYERFTNFQEAALFDTVNFEVYYAITQALRRNRDVAADLEFIRENMLGKEKYSTVEGRPIVQLYEPSYFTWAGNQESQRINNDLVDEYGSLADFVKFVRSELTTSGVEPFLLSTTSKNGVHGFKEEYSDFWGEFDGLTNWTGENPADETVSNEDSLEFMEANYRGIAEYIEEDQVFWPMVFPGFDDRHNEQWGQDRRIPRSTQYFRDLLQLAETYGDGRINIYSFNEWTEGTQIEPGAFRGNDYGTDYLEIIEEFQTPN